MGANIGITLAIMGTIAGIKKLWDDYNVTVEETNQKLEEINEKIKTLNSELEELYNTDNKTSVEDKRIAQLERELEIQQELYEIEQKRKYENLVGTHWTDYFDEDSLAKKWLKEQDGNVSGTYKDLYYDSKANKKKLDEQLANLQKDNPNANYTDLQLLAESNDQLKKLFDDQEEIYEQALQNSSDYWESYTSAKEASESRYLSGTSLERAKEQTNNFRQLYEDNLLLMETIQKQNGTFDFWDSLDDHTFWVENESAIQNIINSGMPLDGITTWLSTYYSGLTEYLHENGVTVETLISKYKELAEVEKYFETEVPKISINQLFELGDSAEIIQKELDELSEGGNVNLKIRPVIDAETMKANGWDEFEDDYATVYSSTFSNYNPGEDIVPENEKIAINFTPIIVDPESGKFLGVLSPDRFNNYCENVLNGVHDDYLNLQIGATYSGEDAIAQAEKDAERIHNLHQTQVTLSDIYNANEIVEIRDDLIGMAQAGKLDADTLLKYEKYDQLLKHLGITATQSEEEIEAMVSAINSISTQNTVDYLNTYRDSLSKLVSAYTSFSKNERITSEQLSELQDAFGDLDSYQEFEEIITTGNGDIQEGFNAIATELAKDLNLFKGLTKETQAYWEADVTASGITNAHALAEAYLNQVEQERLKVIDDLIRCNADLDETKRDCIIASENLEDATADEIKMLILEAGYSYETAQALAMFAIKKQLAEKPLNTAQDVQELLELCSALGATTKLMDAVLQLKMAMGLKGSGVPTEEVDAAIASAQQRIDAIVNGQYEFDFSNIFNFGKVDTDAVSDAGAEAADAWLEGYEKEKGDLEALRDQGKISEKQYLEALKALYERYFAGREKYAKEYAAAEREYLEGTLSHMENAIGAIQTLIQRKIDNIEKARDAAVKALEDERDAQVKALEDQKKAYEKQKDAIQDQIDALDKQISIKEKEIDAIQEANDERQREIDLQKAQYDLNRLMNQRTNLVYTSDQGFVYRADENAIRDQKQEVEDAKTEIRISAIEKEISLIEERKELLEEEQDLIDKKIEALDEQIDSVNEHFEQLIKNTEEMYEQMISSLENQMAKWQELIAFKEVAEAYQLIKDEFGTLGYTVEDVLNGNEQAFNDFKDKYIKILGEMNQNESFGEGLTYAMGELDSSLSRLDSDASAVAESFGKLGEVSPQLQSVSGDIAAIGTASSEASANTGVIADDMTKLGKAVGNTSEDIGNVVTALNNIPDSANADALSSAFMRMATGIRLCATYLGLVEGQSTGSLADELNEIANLQIPTEGGLVAYFEQLYKAINNVITALGGVAGGTGESTGQAGASGGEGGESGSGSDLKSVITDATSTGEQEIGKLTTAFAGEGGSGEGGVAAAIEMVKQKLGSEEIENEDSLYYTLQRHVEYATGEEGVPALTNVFTDLQGVIVVIRQQLETIQTTLESLNGKEFKFDVIANVSGFPAGTGFSIMQGAIPRTFADGTVGHAFASGIKGLPHDEELAVRSEYNQPELTVYPDGTAELTTEPTAGPLPKGTVIFNEDQTKRILQNQGKVGKLFANGTQDYSYLKSYDPKLYEVFANKIYSRFEPNLNCIKDSISEINRQFEKSGNVQNVNNSGNSTYEVSIVINCPNVTNTSGAEEIARVLEREFQGMKLQANQKVHIK